MCHLAFAKCLIREHARSMRGGTLMVPRTHPLLPHDAVFLVGCFSFLLLRAGNGLHPALVAPGAVGGVYSAAISRKIHCTASSSVALSLAKTSRDQRWFVTGVLVCQN